MAGPNGGARPGAGRKAKAEKFAGSISRAERKIADRLPTIIDRMFDLADGVTVQEVDEDGGIRVYTRPPDYKACAYLIDRILGKTKERKEVQASIVHDYVCVDLSDDPYQAQPEDGPTG